MGYYLTSGGSVLELDVPTEGTHARERFEEQLAKQELVPVPDGQVTAEQVPYGADKDGNTLFASRFVLTGDFQPVPVSPAEAPGPAAETGPASVPQTLEEAEVPDGTVEGVLSYVRGTGDPEAEPTEGWEDRAHAALDAEQAKGDKARSTLVDRLTAIIAG